MVHTFQREEADNVCAILETCWPALNDIANRQTIEKKGKIPWYVYFIGAAIYTALAVGCSQNHSSGMGLPHQRAVGFFYAWGAWKQEKQGIGKV